MNSQRANEAMDKIRDEMTQTNHEAITEIGEAMTRLLLASPELSDKIMAEGKTCKGAYAAMEQYARKGKRHCIPPKEAAKLIAEYWEIPVEAMTRAALEQEPQAHATATPQPPYSGSSPCTGEPMAGLISPIARGGHGGISAAAATSMLDDFDALLGGL